MRCRWRGCARSVGSKGSTGGRGGRGGRGGTREIGCAQIEHGGGRRRVCRVRHACRVCRVRRRRLRTRRRHLRRDRKRDAQPDSKEPFQGHRCRERRASRANRKADAGAAASHAPIVARQSPGTARDPALEAAFMVAHHAAPALLR
ncbi:hypothetical protein PSP6_70116 [Paraburkholderia tropica]|nr:hypothetical protein PSP6_70116 [Paraburkholderia tropica]